MSETYPRAIESSVVDALGDTPVVLVTGPRQAGKSTLVQELGRRSGRRYLTLDDATTLAAARSDPPGFLSGLEGPVTIDEVQRAPELFLSIKAEVDRTRRHARGRFLLTGSANVMLAPRVSESLAGRMEIVTLLPLSQREIERAEGNWVDAAFEGVIPAPTRADDIEARIAAGGFPEALARVDSRRREAWFRSYLTTLLQRDVRDLANVDTLTVFPRLVALLAARTASLSNVAELTRSLGVPHATLTRYLALLETVYLLQSLQPWSANLGKRLVKAPKLFLADTGLTASLLGASPVRIREDAAVRGPLMEAFAVLELRKQAEASHTRPVCFHFRTHEGHEVDAVLEASDGRVVAVEVKASQTVTGGDARGLTALRESLGERFVQGVILHAGDQVVPFGDRIKAAPLSTLWSAIRGRRP